MNVLFLIPNWPGPTQVWLHQMIELLEPWTAAVATYVAPEDHWRGRIPALSLTPGLRRIPARLRPGMVSGGLGSSALRRIVQRDNIDVVLCHFANLAVRFERVWRTTDIPLYVHCHGYDVTWDQRCHEWPHFRRWSAGYPARVQALGDRATFIANAQTTEQKLLKLGLPRERVELKYFGTPIPELSTQPRGERPLTLLFLGRLVDLKGPDLTIEGFDRACRRGMNARLVIAGDGPLRSRCETLRKACLHPEWVTLAGKVSPEAGAQLRAEADLFVAHNCVGKTSKQEEAFGVTMIEAMAAGLPVVNGRSGGVAESVVDGKTGILFTPGRIDEQVTAFLTLDANRELLARMSRDARSHAIANFSLDCERDALVRILGLNRPAMRDVA